MVQENLSLLISSYSSNLPAKHHGVTMSVMNLCNCKGYLCFTRSFSFTSRFLVVMANAYCHIGHRELIAVKN